MSAERLETVNRIIAAFARGDVDAALRDVDPGGRVRAAARRRPRARSSGTRGCGGSGRTPRRCSRYFDAEYAEVRDLGDSVLAVGTLTVTRPGQRRRGARFRWPSWHEFRDDRLVHYKDFGDVGLALEAAGQAVASCAWRPSSRRAGPDDLDAILATVRDRLRHLRRLRAGGLDAAGLRGRARAHGRAPVDDPETWVTLARRRGASPSATSASSPPASGAWATAARRPARPPAGGRASPICGSCSCCPAGGGPGSRGRCTTAAVDEMRAQGYERARLYHALPAHAGHAVSTSGGAGRWASSGSTRRSAWSWPSTASSSALTSERPVISAGCSMPSRSRTVGATSARMPPSASSMPSDRDDERHRVERVRRVGRAVGLEHLLGVAVVGGDDAGAARLVHGRSRPRRGRRRRPRSPVAAGMLPVCPTMSGLAKLMIPKR